MMGGFLLMSSSIIKLLLQQIFKKMLFRYLRVSIMVLISKLRGILKPIHQPHFFKYELITHQNNCIYKYQKYILAIKPIFQLMITFHKIKGSIIFYYHSMEMYKYGRISQSEVIKHIQFITHGLFKDNLLGSQRQKDKRRSISPNIHVPMHTIKTNNNLKTPSPLKKTYFSSTEPPIQTDTSKKSRSKRKPIFSTFDEFWKSCESPGRKSMKETTPIMDRINKNIYERFKTQNNAKKELTDSNINKLDSAQRQTMWKDFLGRESAWQKKRNNQLIQKSLQNEFKRTSPQSRSSKVRHNKQSKLQYRAQFQQKQELKKTYQQQRHMSEVQKSIKQLRLHTEKLRLTILNIHNGDSQQPSVQNTHKNNLTNKEYARISKAQAKKITNHPYLTVSNIKKSSNNK